MGCMASRGERDLSQISARLLLHSFLIVSTVGLAGLSTHSLDHPQSFCNLQLHTKATVSRFPRCFRPPSQCPARIFRRIPRFGLCTSRISNNSP
ncbi:hypothetical protein PLICRDRAFT_529386 [Plicaturopsis crispa FD-325 SS-3]|nr:hypothetical protein PLICRDRAFT_529386 [Plicaturopsis crispa FD-325 SS-3]